MTAPAKPSGPAAPSPSAFIAQLIAGILATNLFVAALIGLSIHRSYHQHQEGAEITTQNLAQVLESELAGFLKNDDMALFSVMDEYQRQRAAGSIDKKALNAHIERVRSRLPEIDALRITDAQGLLIFGSGVVPSMRTSLADRPHFIRLRDDPKAGLVISQPQVSRVNQKWVIVLARRIDQPDGTFGGMVFAAISLEHLSRTFSTLNVGPRGIVTLRDGELGIVIRHPEPSVVGSVVGQKTAPAPLREMVLGGQKAGTYTALSTVDGTERTFSYRRVNEHPLLIIVGLATDDYLAEWRNGNEKLVEMAALFILITSVAAWMIYRSWKHRMHSVEALARQETKFRTMADYTYDWEYWQGPNQEILYMTPSCERVTGYSSNEFVADPVLLQHIVHPDDQYVMDQHMRDIAHLDGAMTDFRIVRRDGGIRWISHHCHAVHNENGEPTGRRVSNRDITERKSAENALQESETRLHELFENMGNGVAVYQPSTDGSDFIITSMNRAAEHIENRQCDDLIGKSVKDVFPGIVEMGLLDVFRRVWQSGKAEHFPVSLYHDGRISGWRENYVYKLPSGEIVAIYNDITERKKAEMQLRELNDTLEQRVDEAVHQNMEHERLLIQQSRLAAMGEMI
ncbi:MAG: PAS domain S-box protein, partial [Sulfuricella sp.]